MADENNHAGLDQKTKRVVVYVTVCVASAIALIIIVVVAALQVLHPAKPIPETLSNWGGLIIGFYFGSFVSLLKDWSRESVEIATGKKDSGGDG